MKETEYSRPEAEAAVREAYAELTRFCIRSGLTVTTMESATGGLLASLITDTEGSSAVLKGAFVTYSNEAKILQGVPEEILRKYSVYSRETAAAMAEACAKAYGADVGIGVTGTMGNPDPANPTVSVPGVVYYALAFGGETTARRVEIPAQRTRLAYKLAAADQICETLQERIGQK